MSSIFKTYEIEELLKQENGIILTRIFLGMCTLIPKQGYMFYGTDDEFINYVSQELKENPENVKRTVEILKNIVSIFTLHSPL